MSSTFDCTNPDCPCDGSGEFHFLGDMADGLYLAARERNVTIYDNDAEISEQGVWVEPGLVPVRPIVDESIIPDVPSIDLFEATLFNDYLRNKKVTVAARNIEQALSFVQALYPYDTVTGMASVNKVMCPPDLVTRRIPEEVAYVPVFTPPVHDPRDDAPSENYDYYSDEEKP